MKPFSSVDVLQNAVHSICMMQLFDYVNAINSHKEPEDFDGYNQFIVTRHYSYFADSLMQAQELNVCRGLTDEEHFSYLFNSLRQRRRSTKWFKNEEAEFINNVMSVFRVSEYKARETIRVLGKEKIKKIIAERNGGPVS